MGGFLGKDTFINAAKYLHRHLLSNPPAKVHQHESAQPRDEIHQYAINLPNSNKVMYRPAFGLIHSFQVAAMMPIVVDLHRKVFANSPLGQRCQQLTDKEIEKLQMMSLFSEITRQTEQLKPDRTYNTITQASQTLSAKEYIHYAQSNPFYDTNEELYIDALAIELMNWPEAEIDLSAPTFAHYSKIAQAMQENGVALPKPERLFTRIQLLKETHQIIELVLDFYKEGKTKLLNAINLLGPTLNYQQDNIQLKAIIQTLAYAARLMSATGIHQQCTLDDNEFAIEETIVMNDLARLAKDKVEIFSPRIFNYCNLTGSESRKNTDMDVIKLAKTIDELPDLEFNIKPFAITPSMVAAFRSGRADLDSYLSPAGFSPAAQFNNNLKK